VAHAGTPDRWTDDSRGRQADRPRDIPKSGWRDIAWRVKDKMAKDKLSIVSAGVAFYALWAVFPALVAMVAIYGMVADTQQVEQQVSAMAAILPPQAAEMLRTQMHSIVQTSGAALGVGAVLGLLFALWSASVGIRTLMEALNVCYDEEEKRSTLKFYGTALLLTLGAIVAVVIAIGTVVVLPAVLGFLGLGSVVENLIAYARWPLLAVLVMFGLAVLYRYGPSRDQPQWRWVSPGVVVATLIWIVGSALFSLYVTNFGSYNQTYGAMGAVIILLTWFLLSAYAVLIGAELNAEMERQTKKDTTTGKPQPMGQRRAHAADTVGKTP
jgi:membrane protein